ncbi:MAG: AAA family ATPase [Hyphomonadaceae bacterium]
MKVVAIINYKGGVGKTTCTANIGAELAFRGKRVLMIDMDPQTNLTFSFIRPDEWQANFADATTIKALFDDPNSDLSGLILEPARVKQKLRGRGELHLISSHLGLINVDLELATQLGGATLAQAKQNFLRVHRRLADALETIDSDFYDVILIDCPPNFNVVTKTAIVASDFILVPTKPDYLSTLGIDYLIRNVTSLVKDYNEFASLEGGGSAKKIAPANIGVLFTMIQEYGGGPVTAQDAYIQQIRNQSGLYVFSSYVKQNNTVFADAPESGIPVVLEGHTPGSTYATVVASIENVATEFMQRIGI